MGVFDQVQVSHLPNGLTVVTDYLPDARILHSKIVIFAGALHSPLGKLGAAHYLEHMWCYAHPKRTNADYQSFLLDTEILDSTNFVTRYEETFAYSSGTPHKIRQWMDDVGDAIGQMDFGRDDVERERGPIYQEVNGKLAIRGNRKFRAQLHGIYGDQHHAGFSGGTPEDLQAMRYEDLIAFYQAHYIGNNMMLVTSGPMSHLEALEYASAKFGHLPEGVRNKPMSVTFAPQDVLFEEDELRGVQTDIALRYDASRFWHSHRGEIKLLMNYLGTALYEKLRTEKGLVYSAGATSINLFRDNAFVTMGGELAPQNVPLMLEVTKDVLHQTIPTLAADFDRRKSRTMEAQRENLAHLFDTPTSRGNQIHDDMHTFGYVREPDDVMRQLYDPLTIESVEQVFHGIFGGKTPAMLYSGDTSIPLPTGTQVRDLLAIGKAVEPVAARGVSIPNPGLK